MKFIPILFILICGYSCSSTPKCIDERISNFQEDNSERGNTFIYTFDQDGQTYYIFDSGIAFDATASVVDSECNEVCSYGGFRPAPDNSCDAFFTSINNAEQIWPEK